MLRLFVLLLVACVALRRLALKASESVGSSISPSSVNIQASNDMVAEGIAKPDEPSKAGASSGRKLSFIKRVGDKLYENTKEFRFVSFCVPNIHVVEDPYWHRVDPHEQEDAFQTLSDLGAKVSSTSCLPALRYI